MPFETSLSFRGLNTSPNNLGAGSEGALVEADNVVIRFPDVLEPRRGQEEVTGVVDAPISMIAFRGSDVGYQVTTETAHGYTNGQSVLVSGPDLSPYTITVTSVSSPTVFNVITAVWPGDPAWAGSAYVSNYDTTYPQTALVAFPTSQVTFFDNETFVHSESLAKIKVVGAQTLTGDYTAAKPDGYPAYRLKTAVNGRHLHATTDKGVVVIESADTVTPRVSGIQAPTLPIGTVIADTGSPIPPGWLADGESVAYRVVFGFKDENDVIHLGPPSERIIVTNTTGSLGNVYLGVLLITAPVDANGDLIPGLFVQFYRSAIVTSPTLPTELLQLATEVNVDTTEYTRDSEFFTTDIAPPQFVAAQLPLYTNDEQEGATQANSPAPYATDLASWSQRLWYANTRQPDSLAVQLLGVGGGGNVNLDATGLRIGDTITIDTGATSVTLTASTATDSNAQTFQVYSAGTPAENISRTLEQLATCVNGQVALDRSDIIAYLVTDTTFDIRSNILFRRLTVDAASSVGFTVTYATPIETCAYTSSVGTTHTFTLASHGYLVGDKVAMRRAPIAGFVTQSVTITATTLNTFSFVSSYANITTANRVKRRFANTVWNPDLSVGQTSENQRSPERLYYSKVLEPEAVPALNYIDVGTAGKPILRIQPQRDRLLVLKEEGTFAIYGDYPFSAQLVDDTVQLIAPDSVTAIGSTVFALMDDGVVAITEGSIQPIDEPIDSLLKPYFASSKLTTTATAFGVGYESEKVFALFMPDINVAGYGAKAYVYGLTSGAWTTWSFPQERKCGRVSPSLDAGFYGLASSPYLVKDRKTSTIADYIQEDDSFITSTVRWAPTTLGTPYATKQVREVHFHFREVKRNPAMDQDRTVSAQFSLKTDIVPAGESIFAWPGGDSTLPAGTVIGPAELPLQFRKLVPQTVQRATYYTLGLSAIVEETYWALNGYTLVFDSTSERTGTVR